jgi:hypothetical protein
MAYAKHEGIEDEDVRNNEAHDQAMVVWGFKLFGHWGKVYTGDHYDRKGY